MTPVYITNIETGQVLMMTCQANAQVRCEKDPRWVLGKHEIKVEPVEEQKPKRKPGRPRKAAKVEEPEQEESAVAEPEVDGGIDLQ